MVDGGYFENYGALTALELARKLRALGGGAILPVVVVVSNDADRPADAEDTDLLACDNPQAVSARPARAQARSWREGDPVVFGEPPRPVRSLRQGDPAAHSEILAPLLGLYATRAAHGLAALHALRRDLCAGPAAGSRDRRDLVHIALPEPRRDPPRREEEEAAPMNWVLNAAARRLILETGLRSRFNQAQTEPLCRSLCLEKCGKEAAPAQVMAGETAPIDLSGRD